MDYLLKASGLVVMLFLFYHVFLKNETFFKSIRTYFLIGLVIVISLPLLEIPIYVEYVASKIDVSNFQEIDATIMEETGINWIEVIKTIYFIGVLFFGFKFLIQLISLANLLLTHKAEKQGNYFYIKTTKNISPFSFFNFIIFNNAQFTTSELEQIINHEKAHAIQWHSLDTLLSHVLIILLWFNPFVWLYKKAVQQNLEFLADSYALNLADNRKFYQLTLLKTFQQNYCTAITNNFYNSLIKKRIIMLQKNQSTTKNQWKYALLIPLLAAFIFAFNTKTIAQEKKIIEVEGVKSLKLELIIDKNTTDEELNNEKETIRKEFDLSLSFKGIKRNAKGEIKAIKIIAKNENNQAKFENSGNVPIEPIKISYNSENNAIGIGNVSKIEKSTYSYTIHTDEDAEIKKGKLKKGNYVFVTSDGKKKTWTNKDGKKQKIIVKEIQKGDKNHIWVKTGKNIKADTLVFDGKLKLISEDEEEVSKELGEENIFFIKKGKQKTTDGVKIELNIDEDNASESVFIVEKDGKLIQEKKDKNITVFSSGNEKPLVYIDGELSSNEKLKDLDPNTIESMSVLKGEKAIEAYGEKAKHGVILIILKKQ